MKIRNNIELMATPTEGSHVANVDYVDGKQKTISWADYQALSEDEKNDGTLYDIPDMPTAGQGGIITTYTALDQLGLSAGASVADIVNAMPDCSYAEIGCHREENSYGLEYVTGLPTIDGNFILTVRKYNLYRVDIQAKSSASGAILNDLYIGGMLVNGTTVEWKRVCVTSVEDVALTTATLTSNFTGSVSYIVKNGICYVYVIDLASPTMSSGTQTITALILPPSAVNGWHTLAANNTTSYSDLLVNVSTTGVFASYVGKDNVIYYGSFSYPVKE